MKIIQNLKLFKFYFEKDQKRWGGVWFPKQFFLAGKVS